MDGAASLTPQQRIAAECAARGRQAVVADCIAILDGRPDDVDDRLITVLGGAAADHVIDGGEGGRSGYWPRVWAARGLLHAWPDPDSAPASDVAASDVAALDAATAAVIHALGDSRWRVREMAAKVVAAYHLGHGLDAVAALRADPVSRVRAAAERAVVRLTAHSA
jgi:hypothetical protein